MNTPLTAYIDQENLYHTEGNKGVSNLCKIVKAIGYKDPQYKMQLSQGGSVTILVRSKPSPTGLPNKTTMSGMTT
jgi:hypothetical protein